MHEELTRDKIQQGLSSLQRICSAVIPRLEQLEVSNILNELKNRWNNADRRLANGIGLGLRIDALIPILKELFSVSRDLILKTEEDTALDVASERLAFDNLSRDWKEALLDISPESASDPTSASLVISPMFSELGPLYEKIDNAALDAMQSLAIAKNLENKFSIEIDSLQGSYRSAIDAYNRVEPELVERAARLDELIRLQGKKVLAGRYEADADNEEKAANIFRYATLTVMLAVIILIGLSYYEASEFTLSPVQAGIRIVFSLILSVPAAYLARESAKHRQRQYVLRQTALEIGAIDSYIQTLPIESQNKIKEETAIKLFTPQKLDGFDKDNYPINTQEIFYKLIEGLTEIKKEIKSKKDSKKDDE